MVRPRRVDIRRLFGGLQSQMAAELKAVRKNIAHTSTQGEAREAGWISLLERHLPLRYRIRRAFVVDAWGRLSEQIDAVIFDRQYSPFLLDHQGACYVPAESVYAVLEIKPTLNRAALKYALQKVGSVRSLLRTSTPIPHAGGIYEARRPFEIIGGIVTDDSDWSPPFGQGFESVLSSCVPAQRLNIGCVLSRGTFYVHYEPSVIRVETCTRRDALVFFILKLLQALQSLGTVPAIDIPAYAKSLRIREKPLVVRKPARGTRPRR